MPTICALPKAGRLGARSAMSSRFPYVVDIIANSIVTATRPLGGAFSRLMRQQLRARYGWSPIRFHQ
jgi:hypothetical protein